MTNHQAFASLAIAERAVTHVPSRSSRRRLAGALATALFAGPVFATEVTPSSPHVAQNWPVQTCDDVTGVGSLRYIAAHAQSGDTIDFSQLPTLCGMRDSTITLTAGEIVLHQTSILLVGPTPGDGSVTLSGGGSSRVLKHQAYSPYSGTLTVKNLRIADGYVHDVGTTGGGCIDSDANFYLLQSSVIGCTAKSDTGNASGGGIYARNGTATLKLSTISGNVAQVSTNGKALGGGVAAGYLINAKYAEIEDNHADGMFSDGGGTSSLRFAAAYSTVANNSSGEVGGGVFIHSANTDSAIRNSTFSGNHSTYGGGGIFAAVGNLSVFNSTIAQNSIDEGDGGGLYVLATSGAEIESTIIATNTSANVTGDADLYVKLGALSGAANAVISSNVNLADFVAVTDDPKLAPMAWTGGHTQTHSLLPGSPVIGLGASSLPLEQRGPGYSRTTGPAATVDIGAVQFDSRIFVSDFDQFFF